MTLTRWETWDKHGRREDSEDGTALSNTSSQTNEAVIRKQLMREYAIALKTAGAARARQNSKVKCDRKSARKVSLETDRTHTLRALEIHTSAAMPHPKLQAHDSVMTCCSHVLYLALQTVEQLVDGATVKNVYVCTVPPPRNPEKPEAEPDREAQCHPFSWWIIIMVSAVSRVCAVCSRAADP